MFDIQCTYKSNSDLCRLSGRFLVARSYATHDEAGARMIRAKKQGQERGKGVGWALHFWED